MTNSEKLKKLMIDSGKTLAVAESVTCGNLQALVGSVSDSSKYFKGGLTAYNLGQKTKHLYVDELHASKVNCVSDIVAIQMAKGITNLFNSTFGIGTTGYAEPYPDCDEPIPRAHIAIWSSEPNPTGQLIYCEHIEGTGLGRQEMQQYVAEKSIEALIQHLSS